MGEYMGKRVRLEREKMRLLLLLFFIQGVPAPTPKKSTGGKSAAGSAGKSAGASTGASAGASASSSKQTSSSSASFTSTATDSKTSASGGQGPNADKSPPKQKGQENKETKAKEKIVEEALKTEQKEEEGVERGAAEDDVTHTHEAVEIADKQGFVAELKSLGTALKKAEETAADYIRKKYADMIIIHRDSQGKEIATRPPYLGSIRRRRRRETIRRKRDLDDEYHGAEFFQCAHTPLRAESPDTGETIMEYLRHQKFARGVIGFEQCIDECREMGTKYFSVECPWSFLIDEENDKRKIKHVK